MAVAVIAASLGLLAVLLATYHRDATLEPPADPDPGWDPLPFPNDVARPSFPLAFPGYDPAAVDAAVEALLVAYEELHAAASPDARGRARRSAARRRGVDLAAASALSGPDIVDLPPPALDADSVTSPRADTTEALRAVVALSAIEDVDRRG